MRSLSCLLLLLAACGGNWSPEDIQFLEAIPTRQQLTLAAPAGSSSAQSQALSNGYSQQSSALGPSNVLANVQNTANGVNQFVTNLTGILDLLRLIPPSQRTTDSRTWGPYPDHDHPGFEWEAVIARADASTYKYTLSEQRAGEATTLTALGSGDFIGDHAAHGRGAIHLDNTAARKLGTSTDQKTNTLDLAYDMSTGDANATLTIANSDGSGGTITYVVKQAGGGQMQYQAQTDLDGMSQLETVNFAAEWLASSAGRVDLTATAGDLGSAVGQYSECWDASLQQVYTERNFQCPFNAMTCSEGSSSQCAIMR